MKSLAEYQNRYQHLRFERRDGVLLAQLHSNGATLEWSAALNHELADAFYDIGADRDNRVLILTGTGDAFCERVALEGFRNERGVDGATQLLRDITQNVFRLLDIDVPIIGVVNGPARVHADFPLMGDVVLAADTAVFQDAVHFQTGGVPGDGVHVLWPLLLGPNRGRAFLLLGQEIDAHEALRLGLVAEVHPPDRVLDRAWEIGAQFAQRSNQALRYSRRALNVGLKRAFQEGHTEGVLFETLGYLTGLANAKTSDA